MRVGVLAVLALALVGCASPTTPVLEQRLRGATPDGPVSCGDCVVEWQRAQLWLGMHSNWRINLATDVLLTTFLPPGYDPSYGFQVLRIPAAGGARAQIVLRLVCGNALGCDPEERFVRQAFYHYVATGQDVLAGMGYMGAIR